MSAPGEGPRFAGIDTARAASVADTLGFPNTNDFTEATL